MKADIDTILAEEIDSQGPGAAVAVVKDGSLLYCQGHGFANLEWGQKIQPDTVFRLASITKQFTATAIMLLEKQEKVRIDDLITTYFPDYPTHGKDITIAHLLTHTSGIKSYTSLEGFLEKWSKNDLTHDEMLALFKHLPLDFEPGSQFRYNNSGYYLLGMIIEAMSGMSYEEFVQTHIFQPLGMTHSYYMRNESIFPHRASGYSKATQGYQHAAYLSMKLPFAAGSLGSTLEDLILWNAALGENRFLDKSVQERMYTRVGLTNGQSEDYGFGWGISDYRGHRVVHHGGGIPGFSTFIARFLDDATTIIVLSNLEGFDTDKLTRRLSRLILDIPAVTRIPVSLDADALDRVTGRYDAGEFTFEIVREGDKLAVGSPLELNLIPIGERSFYAVEDEEIEVHFEDAQGQSFNRLIFSAPFFSSVATRIPRENSKRHFRWSFSLDIG